MPGERGGEWGWGENAFGAVFVMYAEVVMVRISSTFLDLDLPLTLSWFSVSQALCCPVSVLA